MEEIKEGRVSKAKNRRSSILKSRRLPLVDMDVNTDRLDTENNFGKKGKKSSGKRVSFSEKLQINEFNRQPSYNENFKGPGDLNLFRILADEPEPQIQNEPGFVVQQKIFGEMLQNRHHQKRKSFDIDSYIENYEASNSMEDDADDNDDSCLKDKSFFHCETIRFDDDDMEFTCRDSETICEDSSLDSMSQDDCDGNIIHPKFGDVSNQENGNSNKSIFESENWYREMLEKARRTYSSKACQYDVSGTDEELEVYPAQSYKAMSNSRTESHSVENAEPRVLNKNGYYWDSIIPRLKSEEREREQKFFISSNVPEAGGQTQSREALAAIGSTGEGSAFHTPAAKKVKLQINAKMDRMNTELDENKEVLPVKESSICIPSFDRNAEQDSFRKDKEKSLLPMLANDTLLSNVPQNGEEQAKSEHQNPAKIQDAESDKVHFSDHVLKQNDDFEMEVQSTAPSVEFDSSMHAGKVNVSNAERNTDTTVQLNSSMYSKKVDVSNAERNTDTTVEFNFSMRAKKVDVSNAEKNTSATVKLSKEAENSSLHLRFEPSGITFSKKQLGAVLEDKESDFVNVQDPTICHSKKMRESDVSEEKGQCPEFEAEVTQSFVSQSKEPKGGTEDALSRREASSLLPNIPTEDALSRREASSLLPNIPTEETTSERLHAKESIHITLPNVSSHMTRAQQGMLPESHHIECLQESNAVAGRREVPKEGGRVCIAAETHMDVRDDEIAILMTQKNPVYQEELGCHAVSSNVLPNEAQYDCGNSRHSLHTSQRILESQNTSDVLHKAQEKKITTSDKQTVVEGTNTCGRADVMDSIRLGLSDVMKKKSMNSNFKVNETYDVFPESDFNRRRSETFYVPKRDSNAFTKSCNDGEDNWLIKGGKEAKKTFTNRRETFIIPKPLFNASPTVEGLGQPRLSIVNIKKKAKDRMSWISREQMIVASTPVHPMAKQDIDDILEVEEKSSSCLEVTSLEKTVNVDGIDRTLTNVDGIDRTLTNNQSIVKGSDEKDDDENRDEKDASVSQSNEKDDIVSNGSLGEDVTTDQQKDEENAVQNEPADNEENGLEEMMKNISSEERLLEFAEVDEDNFNLPLEEDHIEHQARIAIWKRQNLELESQLAELRKKLNDKQKERIAADQILVAAKEERKERDRLSHERKLKKEQRLKENHKAFESCENVNNDELGSKHKEKTEREDEAAVIRKVVRKEDTLKKKEDQDEEIRMIANHAQKQLLPWYLSTWSRSHFEFKLFRFHLTVEFEEMDENSLDFYNILKWDRNITQIKFGTSAKGCNERSEYVASRIFRHVRTDSLMEAYKTTKSLKKLLEEVSKIIMAHRDLFEDLNSVYINKNLIYVDDNTLETEFFSGYGILYTEFRIRCSISEEEAIPSLKLSFHHLSSIDRTEMFQPIIDNATEGPMLFSRVVKSIGDIISEATRKYLDGKPSILALV